ncbi:UDP-2,3-diacylglucosamine diphosphatase [Bacteroidetes bacterium endosymbiont of Geopemphigus sp.]|uniref:UDP-2,3-diacylglucosamine diphosphatase n=1 Tax=Bacteroidetes bacterium endosymbiont of Geopemphigus sp. TaxID=2047937 RepID=UPI001F4D6084|nr:UDP-2,3-diacylglucosamine diphosphatase [Bacteroidetes bacterium endosymbiont of Geopemphigus sp.]
MKEFKKKATEKSLRLSLEKGKKIYFVSDLHLGAPGALRSLEREKKFIRWLNAIETDAQALFILGDFFDFWFEYKEVIPKGFLRVLGKLTHMHDQGISLFFFVGNHDFWMSNYLRDEMGMQIFHQRKEIIINSRLFLIGHGDGLGPKDDGYKRMKKVFTNPLAKFLFRWLHPDIGVRLGKYFSLKNKSNSGYGYTAFLGENKEFLICYAEKKLKEKPYEFFIFGHRHLPLNKALNSKSQYINTGDWVHHFSYAEYDGKKISLKSFTKENLK